MHLRQTRRWLLLALMATGFVLLMADTALWERFLRVLFPDQPSVLHPRAAPLALVVEHATLVAVSSALTVAVGIPLGIWVTRERGKEFLAMVTDITSLGQTFPPVAVLALAVPAIGFGVRPTVVALFFYGLLPVVRNTIAGLRAVPPDVLETARAMGMGTVQILFRVELPLAARVIIAGARVSVVMGVGTATIGAVIGAGGLGSPIIAGLAQFNLAYVIEGALPAAIMALLADQLILNIEASLPGPPHQEA